MNFFKKYNIFGWWLWFVAALFYALDYFQHTAPSVLVEPIATSFHISFTDVGNIMSLYFPVYAISQLPAGYLLDRFGCRWILGIACLIVSLGLYCMVLPSESMLVMGRVLIAIGSAFAFLGALKTASLKLSANAFPIAVGLTNTIGVLGGIQGQSLLNYFIVKFSWQQATLYIVFFGLALAVFILLFLATPKSKKQFRLHPDYKKVFKDKNLWFIALYAGIMVGTIVNAFAELYDVSFLEGVLQLDSEKAAIISSMVFVGIGVGGPLHSTIAKYFGSNKRWMLIACMATIVSFSLIVLSALLRVPAAVLFVLYFATGFFVSSMLLSFSIARCCYPETLHATLFALVNMTISLCGFVFQFLLGGLLSVFLQKLSLGPQASFVWGFLVLLLSLLFSLWLCFKIRSR